uniref:Succinate dehydrogenase assembly factor 4, mitochondrial n=1 Tax=Amphiprion percula TaxID=161767 RepID=A0A3P8RNX4_AMPPE
MYLLRLCASTSRHVVLKGLSVESVFTGCSRTASGAVKGREPLKKAKTPQGRFDSTEDKSKDVLESCNVSLLHQGTAEICDIFLWICLCLSVCLLATLLKNGLTDLDEIFREEFPDDVNPVTKEKGGPRGPEPTRYGDWERKGRCVDF